MRKVLLVAAILGMLVAAAGCKSGPKVPVVGILAFGPDPAVDIAVKGVKDGLKEQGYEDGRNIRVIYQDGQGDMATLQAIAQKYVADKVDIIVPMTTPSLVATAKIVQGTDRIVVFTEVYDPYHAGVAVSPREHPANLVGVASPPPIEATIGMIQELMPNAKRIGTIYNPSEANSQVGVDRMRAEVARRGLQLVERTVAGSSDVQQAAKSLVGQADAIFISGDNTVQLAFDAVVGVAESARIPTFCSDPEWVKRGAVIGLGPGFYEAGKAAAVMIAQILKGADPAQMEIQNLEKYQLVVNPQAGVRQGLTLPEAFVATADQVIKE